MDSQYRVLFDNRGDAEAMISILVPVRDDKRVFSLLASIALITDDSVHICIINDAQPEPLIRELPAPLKGMILYSDRKITHLGEKINKVITYSKSAWVAIIESDTRMHEYWLRDVKKIIHQARDVEVHLGGEVFEKGLNFNNIIFQKDLRIPMQSQTTFCSNDTAWFMECARRKLPVIKHTFECMLYHDALTKQVPHGFRRFPLHVHDLAYMAVKYHDRALLGRCVLAEGYYLIRGMINLPLVCIIAGYYWLRRLTGTMT